VTDETDRSATYTAQPAIVRIRQAVLEAIAAHARDALPQECCGLLLGSVDEIEHAYRARNDRQSATSYLVAPEDHFAALRFARAREIDVAGAYHSHPRGSALPSETDRRDAQEAFLYLIVGGLDQVEPDITAWRLASGNFFAVALVPVP
jgi:proteasome lid subunit RPN8/RPN11